MKDKNIKKMEVFSVVSSDHLSKRKVIGIEISKRYEGSSNKKKDIRIETPRSILKNPKKIGLLLVREHSPLILLFNVPPKGKVLDVDLKRKGVNRDVTKVKSSFFNAISKLCNVALKEGAFKDFKSFTDSPSKLKGEVIVCHYTTKGGTVKPWRRNKLVLNMFNNEKPLMVRYRGILYMLNILEKMIVVEASPEVVVPKANASVQGGRVGRHANLYNRLRHRTEILKSTCKDEKERKTVKAIENFYRKNKKD